MKTLSALIGSLALALMACQTTPAPQTQDEPLKTVKRDGYFVIVRFLDEGTLGQRYGGIRYNAFIARSRSVTPTRFLVFKLNIEEVKQPLFLKLNQMELLMGDKDVSPMDLTAMNRYWEFEDPDQAIPQLDKDQRDKYLREELLQEQISIPAGARVSKLVLFSANFPRSGTARLLIPLFDPQQKLVEKLELSFTF